MSDNLTRPTGGDVTAFLDAVEHPTRREDGKALCAMMSEITGASPVLWGTNLVGFGQYHYRYESGREGDFFKVGFSPRKASLVIYVVPGFDEYEGLLERLGPHKTGRSCLYVTRLARIDEEVLREMIDHSWAVMNERYG